MRWKFESSLLSGIAPNVISAEITSSYTIAASRRHRLPVDVHAPDMRPQVPGIAAIGLHDRLHRIGHIRPQPTDALDRRRLQIAAQRHHHDRGPLQMLGRIGISPLHDPNAPTRRQQLLLVVEVVDEIHPEDLGFEVLLRRKIPTQIDSRLLLLSDSHPPHEQPTVRVVLQQLSQANRGQHGLFYLTLLISFFRYVVGASSARMLAGTKNRSSSRKMPGSTSTVM